MNFFLVLTHILGSVSEGLAAIVDPSSSVVFVGVIAFNVLSFALAAGFVLFVRSFTALTYDEIMRL